MESPRPPTAGDVALILAAAFVASFPLLGQDDDWVSREIYHAEIAREMASGGDWLIPKLCGETYVDKPPLLHWLAALAFKIGGPSMKLARLPSALAACAAVVAAYVMGRSLGSRRAGLFAGLVLCGTPAFAVMARTARPDMLFCAFALLSCAMLGGAPKNISWAFAAGIAAGLAVLAKGPLGLVVPLVFMPTARWDDRRRVFAALAWMLAGAALVVGGWAALVFAHDGGRDYLHAMLNQPDLTHGGGGETPVWAYFGWFAAGFAPYLLLLLPAVGDAWRGERTAQASLVAAVLLFALFCALPGRRWHYLLPVYPFAALAVGVAIDKRPAWTVGASILIGAMVVAVPIYYAGPVKRFAGPNRELAIGIHVRDEVPPDAPLASICAAVPPVNFIARRDVAYVDKDAAAWIETHRGAYVVMMSDQRAWLESILGRPVISIYEDAEPNLSKRFALVRVD